MTAPGFRPTHVVPQHGMPAWEEPDPARPTVDLDPLLPVQLLERRGDWGHVQCSNGWSAWVDGRLLVAVPQDPAAPDAPMARTADPRPLLTRAEEALSRYRSAVEGLMHGELDGEGFGAHTRGLRLGVVVDGESLWLYDPDHGRWLYTDGTRLHTYATDEVPRTTQHPPGPAPPAGTTRTMPDESARGTPGEPTRVVSPDGDLR